MKSTRVISFVVFVSSALIAASARSADPPAIDAELGSNGLPTVLSVRVVSPSDLGELKTLPSDSDRWPTILALRVVTESGTTNDVPAILGRYEVRDSVVRFMPRYPLRLGVRYRAELFGIRLPDNKSPAAVATREYFVPKRTERSTTVAAVYPSSAQVPENLLRFYLHFSGPMARGGIYRFIRLLDENQQPLDLPFLEIGEELWDPTATRLTLLIDPGRIKRGLKPREELGPVLEAGKKYTLDVLPQFPDVDGVPLKSAFRKEFTVGPPRELALETTDWKTTSPRQKTRSELVVDFPFPLDRALIERNLVVEDKAGRRIDGDVTIDNNERRWHFRPRQNWADGPVQIVVETTLEDPCGNRIGRAFEVDVLTPVEKKIVAEFVRIPVRIEKP